MRRGVVVGVILAGVVAIAATVTVVVQRRAAAQEVRDRRAALAIGRRFLADWPAKRYENMTALAAEGNDPGVSYRALDRRLRTTTVEVVPGVLAKDGRHLPFAVHLQLAGLGRLDWQTTLELSRAPNGWRVLFGSDAVYPGLRDGQRLERSTPVITRGQFLDRHGAPIRAMSADLASNVLGAADALRSGLERLYDAKLTGTSGGRVELLDGRTGQRTVIKDFPPAPAGSVTTTLDLGMERAAQAALAGAPGRAALVAIDTATGEVRAVANKPVIGVTTAFASEAPGSVFKIVTATAALLTGRTPASIVSCPDKAIYGGKQFVNDEAPLPPTMSLTTAFAMSCNTAFLGLADTFPKGTLRRTAELYGFDRPGKLLETGAGEGGSVPVPAGTAEGFADAIGQGRVEASPLLVASMAAAVASGTWRQPHLVAGTRGATTPLAPGVAAGLRTLMAAVVSAGTAASAGLPPGTVGKTGTAQFGTATPLRSHAWFAGYRGGLAFCVYVEQGTSGGRTAAPLAASFLRGLPGSSRRT